MRSTRSPESTILFNIVVLCANLCINLKETGFHRGDERASFIYSIPFSLPAILSLAATMESREFGSLSQRGALEGVYMSDQYSRELFSLRNGDQSTVHLTNISSPKAPVPKLSARFLFPFSLKLFCGNTALCFPRITPHVF